MTHRGLFLADGPSDLPLATHLEVLCRRSGGDVTIADVPAGKVAGGTVAARLEAILEEDPDFDIVFVHRDAEGQEPALRFEEALSAAHSTGFEGPAVAFVPIRMTESLLLLDEQEIRRVAGKPNGTTPLHLPTLAEVERIADPKKRLYESLVAASSRKGRRLKDFKRDFGEHRRLLLERVDIDGRVRELTSWQRLEADIDRAIADLGNG